ncbi:MAG TPA: SDR family oxidoreductase [Acidimicrobiales bacterium]|jgi:3-oxoacyl-[acyl-carrier protein] reductase|nr:SDR family oxidoreductase [Acidimicrobiales bacterium]
MDLGLDGKVAVVAAGSRGLGFATAQALAEEGVRLVVSARGRDALESAAESLRSSGAEVATLVADIGDPDAPQRLVDAAVDQFGGLDIVVANAGGPPPARSLDVTEDQLDAALNLNLRSSIRLVRAAVPVLRDRGWGRICCITSYSVVQPVPALALSNTARVGLWAWAKTAAQDLAAEQSGITLNLACPGSHATDRMKELGGSGVMGDPADFGRVVAFLCSQPAGYINGAAIVVDGGATLAL